MQRTLLVNDVVTCCCNRRALAFCIWCPRPNLTEEQRKIISALTRMKTTTVGHRSKRRIDCDMHKILVEGKHHATLSDKTHELLVKYCGPPGSIYENGRWNVKIHLPEDYPFKPPNICFVEPIYHPNIDEASGVISMDVVNASWIPRHNLSDIFDYFLPDLLTEPIFNQPVNKIAAALCLHAPDEYRKVVEEYVRQYAKM